MKNIQKLFAISCLILSTDIFAETTYTFGWTVRQLDLCTDWSCTTPFNLFTGSQYLAVNEKGAVPGAGEININLPTSGTYGYLRWRAKNEFKLTGYGLNDDDDTTYCASGSPTKYATEALAKAAATNTNFSFQLDKWLSWGNGVDASGYGDIIYGYGTGQNNIPGYTSHWSASELNEYTLLIRRDEGNDDFFLTTVLQGDYDFGSGKMPSTIVFGVTMDKVAALGVALADTDNSSPIDRGWTTLTDGSCVTYPAAFLFDYIIQ